MSTLCQPGKHIIYFGFLDWDISKWQRKYIQWQHEPVNLLILRDTPAFTLWPFPCHLRVSVSDEQPSKSTSHSLQPDSTAGAAKGPCTNPFNTMVRGVDCSIGAPLLCTKWRVSPTIDAQKNCSASLPSSGLPWRYYYYVLSYQLTLPNCHHDCWPH